jgi:hypothetical protein
MTRSLGSSRAGQLNAGSERASWETVITVAAVPIGARQQCCWASGGASAVGHAVNVLQ